MLKRESRKHDSEFEFEFEVTAFFNYKFAENLSLGKLLLQFSQNSLNLGDFFSFEAPRGKRRVLSLAKKIITYQHSCS